MSEYRNTIGTVVPRGQVHLAAGTDTQWITCRFGASMEALTHVIAELDQEGCGDETRAALLGAHTRPTALCRNCFYPAFRARYTAAWRAR